MRQRLRRGLGPRPQAGHRRRPPVDPAVDQVAGQLRPDARRHLGHGIAGTEHGETLDGRNGRHREPPCQHRDRTHAHGAEARRPGPCATRGAPPTAHGTITPPTHTAPPDAALLPLPRTSTDQASGLMTPPRRIWHATAPIRIADIGGWTDTWFARHGRVLNLAVQPGVEVEIAVFDRTPGMPQVRVVAANYGFSYHLDSLDGPRHDKLPLIEAAIRRMGIPDADAIELDIHSEIPPGASTGTSAALSVAIVAALSAMSGRCATPYQAARLAHAIEVEDLGLQSGVQDQLCSAYGGMNLIEIHAFPHAAVSPIRPDAATQAELQRRLALFYIGKPHYSSRVHREVIDALGADAHRDPRLDRLRTLAEAGCAALLDGNWPLLGRIWDDNTQVQRELHPMLVSIAFERVIRIAREYGAEGCKVNGAGGDGGSVTVLCNHRAEGRRAMIAAMAAEGFTHVPIRLAPEGLQVWSSSGAGSPARP